MEIKVICNDCGKTGKIDTQKTTGWEFYEKEEKIKNVIGRIPHDYDSITWTIWRCEKCTEEHNKGF